MAKALSKSGSWAWSPVDIGTSWAAFGLSLAARRGAGFGKRVGFGTDKALLPGVQPGFWLDCHSWNKLPCCLKVTNTPTYWLFARNTY